MRVLGGLHSSKLQPRLTPRFSGRVAATQIVFGCHFDMQTDFIVEIAVRALSRIEGIRCWTSVNGSSGIARKTGRLATRSNQFAMMRVRCSRSSLAIRAIGGSERSSMSVCV